MTLIYLVGSKSKLSGPAVKNTPEDVDSRGNQIILRILLWCGYTKGTRNGPVIVSNVEWLMGSYNKPHYILKLFSAYTSIYITLMFVNISSITDNQYYC